MTPAACRAASGCTFALAVVCACAPAPPPPTGPVAFDVATAWVHTRGDSLRLTVEVAHTEAQQEVGLAGRPSLADDVGMLFTFDRLRTTDDGFWMWRTRIALDIAFLDQNGVIVDVLTMEPCDVPDEDDCPGYFPSSPYATALEVNAGWFARSGAGVGDRVAIRASGPPVASTR